jgi:predicted TIM-barrel fold metal-dependent hydrolase
LKLIDIHTHIYPEAISQKATDSIREFYQLDGGGMDGSAGMLLSEGDKAGIDKFIILPVGMRPDRVRHVNDFILSQVAAEPRFIGFGTVHAAMDQLADEVAYIIDQGLRGIKMHPDFQKFNIDDPRLFPLYEIAQDKLPVMFHMGDKRYDFSHPMKLRKLLELFPKLQVIAAHFGGYSMYETAYELLHDKDCIFDISSSLMFMKDGVAEKYINAFGAERMAYGTDYPLWNPVTEVQRFTQLKLTDDQFEQIAHKTVEQYLNI